ncbi:MAG: hypothetical protein PHF14_04940 [Verrucomicrobiota bacterium]|nr:hypothetical protein [Verrucomicrobiota bacterium]MDI9385312.1 hypothetical protein [Verrucomicrobiota bacterium]
MDRLNSTTELCQHRNSGNRFRMSDSHHASFDTKTDRDPDLASH